MVGVGLGIGYMSVFNGDVRLLPRPKYVYTINTKTQLNITGIGGRLNKGVSMPSDYRAWESGVL